MLTVIENTLRIFKMEMCIDGHIFSFWDIFIFGWIVSIIAYIIHRIFEE